MRQIGATPTGSYAVQPGKQGVLVGVIDTGIDGTHPDIAPNFDAADSQNFVTDLPVIDGPCEVASCVDPANVDDDGHGTHVASTIASPINGIGIAGVAPNVRLVNLRAGQDSGYFFLGPTLNAITAAGDLGVDVINMSFYTDPWLFNCIDNPADSAAEQAEQRVIRTATQRALNYARSHGVLPIAAAGNESTDLGNPTFDDTSPDFPVDTAHDARHQQLVHQRPVREQGRRGGQLDRHLDPAGVLLQLRHRAVRRGRAGWRLLRHPDQHARPGGGDHSRRTRRTSRSPTGTSTPTATSSTPASSSRTAPVAASARTTSGSRAPRWRRPTRSASRR